MSVCFDYWALPRPMTKHWGSGARFKEYYLKDQQELFV